MQQITAFTPSFNSEWALFWQSFTLLVFKHDSPLFNDKDIMWCIFKHDTDMWYLVSHFVTSKITLLWHSSVSYDVNVGHRSLIMHLVPKKREEKDNFSELLKVKSNKRDKEPLCIYKIKQPCHCGRVSNFLKAEKSYKAAISF